MYQNASHCFEYLFSISCESTANHLKIEHVEFSRYTGRQIDNVNRL